MSEIQNILDEILTDNSPPNDSLIQTSPSNFISFNLCDTIDSYIELS